MIIGIDISQMAFEKTGVSSLVKSLVLHLLQIDKENEYVLFFSSLRRSLDPQLKKELLLYKNAQVKLFKFPPLLLDVLWNRLHIVPIEWLIGNVDVFITSDWTEPPTLKAKKATILYDLIVYKYPQETDEKIVAVQKRKLAWVKKESAMIFCISEATKQDAIKVLNIKEKRLQVMYPGL